MEKEIRKIDIDFIAQCQDSEGGNNERVSVHGIELDSTSNSIRDLIGTDKLVIYGRNTGPLTDELEGNGSVLRPNKYTSSEKYRDLFLTTSVVKQKYNQLTGEYENCSEALSGQDCNRGYFSFNKNELNAIEDAYRREYNNSEIPYIILAYRKITEAIEVIARDIEESKEVIYDELFRSRKLNIPRVKAIFDRISDKPPLLIPEGSEVVVRPGYKWLSLKFKDWFGGVNIDEELFEFDLFYYNIFGVHLFSGVWSYAVLIKDDRPLLDPLKKLITDGTLGNCQIVNADNPDIVSGHRLCEYPKFDLRYTFRPITRTLIGYDCNGRLNTFSFSDSIYESPMLYYSSAKNIASFHARLSLSKEEEEMIKKEFAEVNISQFPEVIRKFEDRTWTITVESYESRFLPTCKIRGRLAKLGIYNYEFSAKIYNDLDNLTENTPFDKKKEIVLSYIEYLNETDPQKAKDLKDSVFSTNNSLTSKAAFTDDKEKFFAKEFYEVFKEIEKSMDLSSKEYYFGTNRRQNPEEFKDGFVLRKLSLTYAEYKELLKGKNEIVIQTEPLLTFIESGLKLGMSIETILGALDGDNYKRCDHNYYTQFPSIYPKESVKKSTTDSATITKALLDSFLQNLYKSNAIGPGKFKIRID